MTSSSRPIIIVTGANGGVGFGICQRLLEQLAQKKCPDARAPWVTQQPPSSDEPVCDGLTLIMACRSLKRAEAARMKLLYAFREYVERCTGSAGYDGHAERFELNLTVDVLYLDLAVVSSVFQFSEQIAHRYPYVSHIICNAGVGGLIGIDWPVAIKQVLTTPVAAVTTPLYNLQRSGEVSADGLGWVWQCNVFGHYVLFRCLESVLKQAPRRFGGRVVWMSSHEASHKFYDAEDYQLIKTNHAYETSKYYIDVISVHLDSRAVASSAGTEPTIRHVVVDPGIASTSISNEQIGAFLNVLKLVAFYFARVMGSQCHTITLTNAAVAAIHMSLLPLTLIPSFPSASVAPSGKGSKLNGNGNGHNNGKANSHLNGHAKPPTGESTVPLKYSAQANLWGNAYVGTCGIPDWEEFGSEGKGWLDQCEELYERFSKENAIAAASPK